MFFFVLFSGESEYTLSKYKIVTKKLLNLPENQLVPE